MAELIIFGGEKGGVGKSFVCRTAIEYHLTHGIDCVVFEVDRSNPDCKRIYGNHIDCRFGIMSEAEKYEDASNQIFNIATEKRTLVNLPAQVMPAMKLWFEQNDLLGIAHEAGVSFHMVFVADGGYDSLSLLRKTLEYFGGNVRYTIVKNYARTDDWEGFDQDKPLQKLIHKHRAKVIGFPKFIGSLVRNQIDAESLTFGQALEFEGFGVIEKSRVRKFLRESFQCFDDAGVFR